MNGSRSTGCRSRGAPKDIKKKWVSFYQSFVPVLQYGRMYCDLRPIFVLTHDRINQLPQASSFLKYGEKYNKNVNSWWRIPLKIKLTELFKKMEQKKYCLNFHCVNVWWKFKNEILTYRRYVVPSYLFHVK